MNIHRARQGRRAGFTLVELLVVISIIGMLASIILPAVNAARESGRRAQCTNNIKQLALAVHIYHDSHRHTPVCAPETTNNNRVAHGWIIQVTPYLELQQVYDRYDFAVNWNHANNKTIRERDLPILHCASTPDPTRVDVGPRLNSRGTAAITDYSTITNVDDRLVGLGLVDVSGLGAMPKNADPYAKSRFEQIRDGLSNTILVAESAGRPQVFRGRSAYSEPPASRVNGGAWARPASDFALLGSSTDGVTNLGPCAVNCTNGIPFTTAYPDAAYGTTGSGQAYSFHPAGVNVVFADGSVHFLTKEIDTRIMANLVTRAGNEMPPVLD